MDFWYAIFVTCIGPWGEAASICIERTRQFDGLDAFDDCIEYVQDLQQPSVVEHFGYDPNDWQEKGTSPACVEGVISQEAVETYWDFLHEAHPAIYTHALRNKERATKPMGLTLD